MEYKYPLIYKQELYRNNQSGFPLIINIVITEIFVQNFINTVLT
jgi:hypothetical protein